MCDYQCRPYKRQFYQIANRIELFFSPNRNDLDESRELDACVARKVPASLGSPVVSRSKFVRSLSLKTLDHSSFCFLGHRRNATQTDR